MKAIKFWNASRPLTLESLPDPVPGTGEMVLRVGRCGICGTDVHFTRAPGYYPENSILGHEFAGEVVALGVDVERFRIGDRVTALPVSSCGHCTGCLTGGPFLCENGFTASSGGFAEYVRVAASSAIKLPSSLSLTDGALVEPLAVALHGVRLGGLGPADRVLVLGAGAVGLGVAYWARKLGARRVAVASRSPRRAELARKMGADAFVVTGEGARERIAAALGGPPNLVFECLGVPGSLAQAVEFVKPMGTVVSLGMCIKPDTLLPVLATLKQVRLSFSLAYTLEEFELTADTMDRGHLEPRQMVMPTPVSLQEVPALIDRLRQGGGEAKIHVDPWLVEGEVVNATASPLRRR